jgi:hypothetical protein
VLSRGVGVFFHRFVLWWVWLLGSFYWLQVFSLVAARAASPIENRFKLTCVLRYLMSNGFLWW